MLANVHTRYPGNHHTEPGQHGGANQLGDSDVQFPEDAHVGHQRSTILSFESTLHAQKARSRPLKWRFHLAKAKAKVGDNSTNYTRRHPHCQMPQNAIGAGRLLLPGLPHSIPAPSFSRIPPATRSARANRLLARPTHGGWGAGWGTASGPHLQVLTATAAFATFHLLGEGADQASLKAEAASGRSRFLLC